MRVLLGIAAFLAVVFVGMQLVGHRGSATVPLAPPAPVATSVASTTTSSSTVVAPPGAPRDPFKPLVDEAPPTTVAPPVSSPAAPSATTAPVRPGA